MLCSETEEKYECIEYIAKKLRNSGYKNNEIEQAMKKALTLNRKDLLKEKKKLKDDEKEPQKQLTFMISRDDYMSKKIKSIVKENQADIDRLLGGPTQVIIAERKKNSTASLVFAKSSFSKCLIDEAGDQKCRASGCMTCKVMDLKKRVTLWKENPERKVTVKLDYRCNCVTENCIYLYVCKLCKGNEGFYVGQTTNTCRTRANGHRSVFNFNDYGKSALSYHVFEEHPDHIMQKLNNYRLGVIKSRNPMDLDRTEDFYVELTDANLSLNRYKVTTL